MNVRQTFDNLHVCAFSQRLILFTDVIYRRLDKL